MLGPHNAAPTLAAQAESLLAQGQLDAAIEQLDFALTIAPRDAAYRLRRAHLLQASLRLQEAGAAYRSALALGADESASTNLALTEKLLAKWPATGQPDAQILRELYDAIRAQGRIAESLPLGQRLGLGAQATEDAIRLVFRAWENLTGWGNGKRFVRETDGTFSLQLNGLPIQDISPLRALRDLPISGVNLGQTLVTDLSPLAVLPLRDVNLVDSAVTDLAGLRGLKLKRLMIQSTKVRSLEPLRGMPLVWIDAAHCPELTDLEPLRGMALESLNLEFSQKITSIDALSGMPLKGISVGAVPISDIRPLRGMPLESAYISGPFQNLEPLKGAPLKSLLVTGALNDLNALRGSPVEDLLLAHCGGIKDFMPLLDCPRLNRLLIHPSSSGVEKLRPHPTLKLIGFDGQFRPVAEFLDEWEAQHPAAPK